jgi:hypothetical protein
MSYEVFRRRVNALIVRSGGGIVVSFTHDDETGRHIAICTNGVIFIANDVSLRVTVRWGSGHLAVASI